MIALVISSVAIGGTVALVIWLLWPSTRDTPPPSPDEYWAEREKDERARRGVE